MTTKTEKTEKTFESRVALIAWKVAERKGKKYWTRVGVAYKPHDDGEGFTAEFVEGVAVSGKVIFRKPKPEQIAEAEAVTTDEEIPF